MHAQRDLMAARLDELELHALATPFGPRSCKHDPQDGMICVLYAGRPF